MSSIFKYIFLCAIINVQFAFKTCEECATQDDLNEVVCGKDGRTYLSKCFADCAKVGIKYTGRCSIQGCPQLYYPVCTASGKTYMNECEANYYSEKIVAPGYCIAAQHQQNLLPKKGYAIQEIQNPIQRYYQWP